MKVLPILAVTGMLLSGCATWSTSNVALRGADADGAPPPVADSTSASKPAHAASDILLTANDLLDRKYETIGDIEVTVNKTTIFNADPTREMVDMKLREEAARLNADAVILVRYGTVGIGLMSWGSLEGKGRAVKFAN